MFDGSLFYALKMPLRELCQLGLQLPLDVRLGVLESLNRGIQPPDPGVLLRTLTAYGMYFGRANMEMSGGSPEPSCAHHAWATLSACHTDIAKQRQNPCPITWRSGIQMGK